MINLIYFFKMYECGHFCINYVLKKEGLKNKTNYEREFMNLGLISRVLENYYDIVNCYRVSSIKSLKESGRFITLLKLKNNRYHYIVVEKMNKGFVYYYDPAFLFMKKVKVEKFIKNWSHYCCLCKKK